MRRAHRALQTPGRTLKWPSPLFPLLMTAPVLALHLTRSGPSTAQGLAMMCVKRC